MFDHTPSYEDDQPLNSTFTEQVFVVKFMSDQSFLGKSGRGGMLYNQVSIKTCTLSWVEWGGG